MSGKEALMWDVNRGMSVNTAAEVHGVTRSCAYKWVNRYKRYGAAGLEELSRTPEHSPNRTAQSVVTELVELKRKHPLFGPAKLTAMIEKRHGERILAVSTAGEILSRHGLVRKRRSQRSAGPIERGPFEVAGAGDSMTTDYKGQFRMANKVLCYPLTIADPFSRYVFAIDALTSTATAGAKTGFERVFREFGIPRQMISDNGTPFCSAFSLGGLTQLSRWWIELGITPIRIQPGHPQQNGAHERMHRTLQDWIDQYPQPNLRAQQRSFNVFSREFNHVRPHQSLGQKPPATAVKPYRPFSSRPKTLEYDSTMAVRLVSAKGFIQWKGQRIFASEVLSGANIGLLPIDETVWSLYFGTVRIGYLDGLAQRVQNRLPERSQAKRTPDKDAG
jgi:transposase InsO family protein